MLLKILELNNAFKNFGINDIILIFETKWYHLNFSKANNPL